MPIKISRLSLFIFKIILIPPNSRELEFENIDV